MNEAVPADPPIPAPPDVAAPDEGSYGAPFHDDDFFPGDAPFAPRLSPGGRAAAAVLMTLLVAGFGLARFLTPAEEGLGTHQQLGLPPCTVRVIAGIPCPACGMTTSFAHFTRGQWVGSVSANSGGFVLALLCLALIPLLGRAALTGRLAFPRVGGRADAARPEWWGVLGLSAVGAVTLIDWAFRLAE